MKAIILKAPGGTTQLEYTDIPVPVLREGEVLVRVRAISINPVDIKSRSGKGVYGRIREEDPLILGWDISGTVEKSNSHRFRPGDKVFGMVNFPGHGKAYAEYVAAPAEQLALKPENQSHTEAAAATLVALTAWQALITHAQIQQGQHPYPCSFGRRRPHGGTDRQTHRGYRNGDFFGKKQGFCPATRSRPSYRLPGL